MQLRFKVKPRERDAMKSKITLSFVVVGLTIFPFFSCSSADEPAALSQMDTTPTLYSVLHDTSYDVAGWKGKYVSENDFSLPITDKKASYLLAEMTYLYTCHEEHKKDSSLLQAIVALLEAGVDPSGKPFFKQHTVDTPQREEVQYETRGYEHLFVVPFQLRPALYYALRASCQILLSHFYRIAPWAFSLPFPATVAHPFVRYPFHIACKYNLLEWSGCCFFEEMTFEELNDLIRWWDATCSVQEKAKQLYLFLASIFYSRKISHEYSPAQYIMQNTIMSLLKTAVASQKEVVSEVLKTFHNPDLEEWRNSAEGRKCFLMIASAAIRYRKEFFNPTEVMLIESFKITKKGFKREVYDAYVDFNMRRACWMFQKRECARARLTLETSSPRNQIS